MTFQRRARLLALLLGLVALASPAVAGAHPLGNFTVNRYARLEIGAEAVRLHYVLDLAEIPTFQEITRLDEDRSGTLDEAEQGRYLARRQEEVRRGLRLELDGRPVELQNAGAALETLPGQGGLPVLRLTFDYRAPAAVRGTLRGAYRDENEPNRLGWKEVVVRPGPGVALAESSAPSASRSDELRSYPADLLDRPLEVRQATFTVGPAGGPLAAALQTAPVFGGVARAADPFADLVAGGELSPTFVLFALLAALGLGALHALGPGHGKTVVAAYLVGSRGTAKHAVFLGLTVTITHTLGVYALGLVTLYASEYVLPERLLPWLSLVSGLMVLTLGGGIFLSRLRAARAPLPAPLAEEANGRRPGAAAGAHVGRALVAVGAGGGDRAARAAVAADGHGHGHDHAHDHHAERWPGHGHHHDHDDNHDHGHDHRPGPVHRHGGVAHSHLPPGADGRPVTWRSLLALGVSGGLLPCPSALVVLLSAIALHRVGFGLLLIVAFSVGLAGVLTGIGLALVLATRLIGRVPLSGPLTRLLPLARVLPVASASLVLVVGLAITVQALGQL